MPGFKSLCAEATEALSVANFAEAECLYKRALTLIIDDEMSHDGLACRCQVVCSLASLLMHLNCLDQAENQLISAVNYIERQSAKIPPLSPFLAPLFHQLGLLYRNSAKSIEAVNMFDLALAHLPPEVECLQLAASLMGRGLASADMLDHAAAAQSFLMVQQELEKNSISPSRRKLEAKVCAASSLIKLGDFLTAESICRTALEMWEIIGG